MITEFYNCIPVPMAIKMVSAVFNKTDYTENVGYVFEKYDVTVAVKSTGRDNPIVKFEFSNFGKICIIPTTFMFCLNGQELKLWDESNNLVVIGLEYDPNTPWNGLVNSLTMGELPVVHKLAELIAAMSNCGMDVIA